MFLLDTLGNTPDECMMTQFPDKQLGWTTQEAQAWQDSIRAAWPYNYPPLGGM
jgi:hypothetical protein